jgi:hypothetical protein
LLPVCDPIVGGLIVKIGPTQLTTRLAQSLTPHVDAELNSAGIHPALMVGTRAHVIATRFHSNVTIRDAHCLPADLMSLLISPRRGLSFDHRRA